MAKQPRFGQLERLADYREEGEERYLPKKWNRSNRYNRHGQTKKPEVRPVDEFIDDDTDAT